MTLPWKQLLPSIICCLAARAEDVMFLGPRWMKEPSDVVLPINSDQKEVTLECLAEGTPPPQYRWWLNGTLIDPSSDLRRRMFGGSLIISELDRNRDGGEYQCVAASPVGMVLSRTAGVTFAYLDHFKAQMRNAVSVREGQGVVLLCGPPQHSGDLDFAWVFNNYPNYIQQDSRRFVSQETGSLYIAKVEPSDVGNYTCVVTNAVTQERALSSPTLLILRTDGVMGEYEPKIELHFADPVSAARGSMVRLECFALGNPVPGISWRHINGVPFPSKVKTKKASAVLEIPNFQQEDTGTYECVAENSRGRNAARGRLSFYSKPQWAQTMRNTALSIGDSLYWECKANGKPKASYGWLKNGSPLIAEGRVQIENGALSVSWLNVSDAGMYQCVAENRHGRIYSSAQLLVLASAPSFSQSPMQSVVKARWGSEVTLTCRPQASPQATRIWKKNNELLQRSQRYTVLPDGTLSIRNVTGRDGGAYTCVARNQFGTASTTGRLMVTEPTRISQAPADMEIIVGESIVLPCQVVCDPVLDVTFSWTFNAQPIDFLRDGDHFGRVGGGISGDLMIRNIQLHHGGKYVCVVDTDVENLSAAAVLVVKGPPGPPETVTVEEITDSTAQLLWSPGRDNGSPITSYTIQGRTAFTVGWQALSTVPELIDGNTLTATVVDLNAWVEYEFRLVASNSVGLGEPSPPSPRSRTEDAVPDTAPTNVGGGGGTKSELVITWEPVPEELQNGDGFGYIIAFRPLGGVTWTRAVISTPAVAQYVYHNDTIPPFSPFNVKVGAYNNKGEGPFSSVVTVFSAEEVPSTVPEKVSAKSVSASQIIIAWDIHPYAPERVLGYEVRYWEDDTKPDTVGKARVPGNQTSAMLVGLKGNTQYFISVSTFNTAGTGSPSLTVTTTTEKPPPAQPPMNIEWSLFGYQLRLHWDPVVALETESQVSGYQVTYRKYLHNHGFTVTTNRTSLELSLPTAEDYLVQVQAMSQGGEGTASETIHIHRLSMGARGSRAAHPHSVTFSLLFLSAFPTFTASSCS